MKKLLFIALLAVFAHGALAQTARTDDFCREVASVFADAAVFRQVYSETQADAYMPEGALRLIHKDFPSASSDNIKMAINLVYFDPRFLAIPNQAMFGAVFNSCMSPERKPLVPLQ